MELVLGDGYGLILVIWAAIWTLAGAGLVATLVGYCNREERDLTDSEKAITAAPEPSISRVA